MPYFDGMEVVRDALVSLDMLYCSSEVPAPLEVHHIFPVRQHNGIFLVQHFYLTQD